MKKTMAAPTVPKLPKYMRKGDLKRPSWKSKVRLDWKVAQELQDQGVDSSQQMWHVGDWGWCAPVLLIRKAGRRSAPGTSDRNYAVRLDTGSLVRIGLGPHVGERVTVYLTKTNLKRLAPFIECVKKGAIDANTARDRRSSRSLQRSLWRF